MYYIPPIERGLWPQPLGRSQRAVSSLVALSGGYGRMGADGLEESMSGELPPMKALINLGDLSKPADTLIKKISNAVGVLFEPRQIKRVAEAKAEAARTEAQSKIEITELRRRAARRWIEEEAQRQKNMEDVTAKAVAQLNEEAQPDSVEDDWLVNFFDKSRIVSDNEMQELWSRVLAGEANAPGTYSKRTVNFLSDLDKAEADLFTKLCGFVWMIGRLRLLVFDAAAGIYNSTRLILPA